LASTAPQLPMRSVGFRLAQASRAAVVTAGGLLALLGLALVEWVGEPRHSVARAFLIMIPGYAVLIHFALRALECTSRAGRPSR